jgi:murein DD-endopeptidase MepM/ murein hydrolase activator NlpD
VGAGRGAQGARATIAAVRPRPPHAPAPAAALAAALLCVAAACAHAHAPEKMTFAEAGLALPPSATPADEPQDDAQLPPPVAIPAPETVALELPTGPPIDATLSRFIVEARSRRGRLAPARGYPEEVAQAWRDLTGDLDVYLARPLPQTPLLELVRARVTIEAEWDYDRRRFGAPPPKLAEEIAARAARFGRRVDTARALGFALFTRPPPAKLRWPVEQAGLSSPFGMRVHPLDGRRRMHQGIDLAASPGKIVAAAAAGWVVRTGWAGGHGLLVEVRHAGDITTRYSHLSAVLCAAGDAVDAGHPLGLVGKTGITTGPHLHFEVWRGGEPSDPLPWLGLAAAGSAGR